MADIVSVHHYPHPRIRRLVTVLLLVVLIVMVVAIVVELVLGLVAGPLMFGIALFTAILLIPLLMRTVLHPEIELTADGLYLHPMIWNAQFVSWNALATKTDHPLLYNNDATGRLLHGKRYRPREGMVIVVDNSAGLLPIYRLVGSLAGAGNRPAFAISSTTHTDYEVLRDTIMQHLTLDRTAAREKSE